MPIHAATFLELTEAALDADFTRLRRIANATARELAADGNEEAAVKLRAELPAISSSFPLTKKAAYRSWKNKTPPAHPFSWMRRRETSSPTSYGMLSMLTS